MCPRFDSASCHQSSLGAPAESEDCRAVCSEGGPHSKGKSSELQLGKPDGLSLHLYPPARENSRAFVGWFQRRPEESPSKTECWHVPHTSKLLPLRIKTAVAFTGAENALAFVHGNVTSATLTSRVTIGITLPSLRGTDLWRTFWRLLVQQRNWEGQPNIRHGN